MTQTLRFSQIDALFGQVAAGLAQAPWFTAENWLTSQHVFPPTGEAEGLTFQLYKPHWFNQEHHGIHLESYLAYDARKQARSFVTLHLLHTPTLPGTAIPRKRLAQAVVDALRPTLDTWPDYTFRAGAYGQQPFVRRLDGRAADFGDQLQAELARLCPLVGPVVDTALRTLGVGV